MKYCIGCVHCIFRPGESAVLYSEHTFDSGSDPELFCAMKHWKVKAVADRGLACEDRAATTQEEFQRFMESAETCPDWRERPSPQS